MLARLQMRPPLSASGPSSGESLNLFSLLPASGVTAVPSRLKLAENVPVPGLISGLPPPAPLPATIELVMVMASTLFQIPPPVALECVA